MTITCNDSYNQSIQNKCNTYVNCQVEGKKKITFKNDKFEYDNLNPFSLGNNKALRLDNLAWIQIKNLMINHNKKSVPTPTSTATIPEKFHYSIMETTDKKKIVGWDDDTSLTVNKIIISNEGKTIIAKEEEKVETPDGMITRINYYLYILYKNEDNKFIYVFNNLDKNMMDNYHEKDPQSYINYSSINLIEKNIKTNFEDGDYLTLKIEDDDLFIIFGNEDDNPDYKKLKTVPNEDIEGGIKIPDIFHNKIMKHQDVVTPETDGEKNYGLILKNTWVNSPMLSLKMNDKSYYDLNNNIEIPFPDLFEDDSTFIIISSNGESLFIVNDSEKGLAFQNEKEIYTDSLKLFNLKKTSDNKFKYVYQNPNLNQKDEFYFTFKLNGKNGLMIKSHLGPRFIPSGKYCDTVRTDGECKQWDDIIQWIPPIGKQNLINSEIKPPKNILGIHKMMMISNSLSCEQDFNSNEMYNPNLIEWQPFYGLVPIETKYNLLDPLDEPLTIDDDKNKIFDSNNCLYCDLDKIETKFKKINRDTETVFRNWGDEIPKKYYNKKMKYKNKKFPSSDVITKIMEYINYKLLIAYYLEKFGEKMGHVIDDKYYYYVNKNKIDKTNKEELQKLEKKLDYDVEISIIYQLFDSIDKEYDEKIDIQEWENAGGDKQTFKKMDLSDEKYDYSNLPPSDDDTKEIKNLEILKQDNLVKNKIEEDKNVFRELKKKYEKFNIEYWKKQGIEDILEAEKKMLDSLDQTFFYESSVCGVRQDLEDSEKCIDEVMSELKKNILKKEEISMYEILITHLGYHGLEVLFYDIDIAPDEILLGDIFIKNINNMPWLIDNLIVSEDGKTITISNENKEYKYELEDKYILGVGNDAGKNFKIGSKYYLQIDGKKNVNHWIFFRENKDSELVINFSNFIDMQPLGCLSVGNNYDTDLWEQQDNKSWDGYNLDANKDGSKWGGQVLIIKN